MLQGQAPASEGPTFLYRGRAYPVEEARKLFIALQVRAESISAEWQTKDAQQQVRDPDDYQRWLNRLKHAKVQNKKSVLQLAAWLKAHRGTGQQFTQDEYRRQANEDARQTKQARRQAWLTHTLTREEEILIRAWTALRRLYGENPALLTSDERHAMDDLRDLLRAKTGLDEGWGQETFTDLLGRRKLMGAGRAQGRSAPR